MVLKFHKLLVLHANFLLKGEVCISSRPEDQGTKGLACHHANCIMELSPSIQVKKLPGWDGLLPSDQSAVNVISQKLHSKQEAGVDIEGQEAKDARHESTSKAGTKCRNDAYSNSKSKVAKAEGYASEGMAASVKNVNDSRKASDLESRLEAQTKEIRTLKDDLKKHVTAAELLLMLEINNQYSTGSDLDLCDRCADGMMFGPLACCPICSGSICYSGGMYRCHGTFLNGANVPTLPTNLNDLDRSGNFRGNRQSVPQTVFQITKS